MQRDASSSDDDGLDYEIVQMDKQFQKRLQDARMRIPNLHNPTSEIMESNSVLEDIPIIIVDPPTSCEATDYYDPKQVNARPLMDTHLTVDRNNLACRQHTKWRPTEDKIPDAGLKKEENGDGAKDANENDPAATKESGYQRPGTKRFQQAVLRTQAHTECIDKLRGWMGMDDNEAGDKSNLKAQVKYHRTSVPPLTRATIAMECLPVVESIMRTYRSYYPDQSNATGWNLAVQANKCIQTLKDTVRSLTVKTRGNAINNLFSMLGLEDKKSSIGIDHSQLSGFSMGSRISSATSMGSRISRGSRMSNRSRVSRKSNMSNTLGIGGGKRGAFGGAKRKVKKTNDGMGAPSQLSQNRSKLSMISGVSGRSARSRVSRRTHKAGGAVSRGVLFKAVKKALPGKDTKPPVRESKIGGGAGQHTRSHATRGLISHKDKMKFGL